MDWFAQSNFSGVSLKTFVETWIKRSSNFTQSWIIRCIVQNIKYTRQYMSGLSLRTSFLVVKKILTDIKLIRLSSLNKVLVYMYNLLLKCPFYAICTASRSVTRIKGLNYKFCDRLPIKSQPC